MAHDGHTAPVASAPRRAAQLGSETWEHVFVTSQGSAYGRLRRALDTGNATIALAAAAELELTSQRTRAIDAQVQAIRSILANRPY